MTEDEIVQRFSTLFAGRTDAYGAVWGEAIKEPLTDEVWRSHLFGEGSVGVYPLVDGKVHWGATDIDLGYEQSWPLALNIQAALRAMNIPSYIERTREKGFHVFVFLPDGVWVDASVMRNALLVAHQIAGVPPTEVNPKQVDGVKLGNYVNLPYARSFVNKGKRVILNADGIQQRLQDFLYWVEHAEVEPLTVAADLYVPPPPPKRVVLQHEPTEAAEVLAKKLSGLGWTIFSTATPLPGKDRSSMLAHFAYTAKDDGLTPDECFVLLEDIDARCGKFVNRKDREERLMDIVTRAYR